MISSEDLAWVQGRLRNCRNMKQQLGICAECLRVPKENLLAALGFADMDALEEAYRRPGTGKRKSRPAQMKLSRTVDPVIREGVLRYAGGEPYSSVIRLLGYKKMPTLHALRGQVHLWKRANPGYARLMPKRPRENQIQGRVLTMNVNKQGLPAYAYAVSPYTNCIIRVVRGETAFFGIPNGSGADALNAEIGVSAAQAAAMYNGVICGWDTPMADPDNYNAAGAYIGPEMEKANGELAKA